MRFGNQQGDFWRDRAEGVAQVIGTRLQLWRGEWFLDVDEGTAYLGGVLGERTHRTIEPTLRTRIAGAPGFASFDYFDLVLDGNTRTASLEARVETVYGLATVTAEI